MYFDVQDKKKLMKLPPLMVWGGGGDIFLSGKYIDLF
jgi:hypothetical protein